MIIIRRPNPAFFGNLPSSAIDSDNQSKPTPSSINEDAQSCRRFVLVPSSNANEEVAGATGAAATSTAGTNKMMPELGDKMIMMDPGVILEKNPLHFHETTEMAVLLLDVASFKPDQLKIEIDNHVLTITGKRTNKLGDTFATHRRFALHADTYDEDNISANIDDDGILEITIQKRMAPKSRQISITVGGGKSFSSTSSPKKKTNDDTKNHHEEISVETVKEDGDDDGDDDRGTKCDENLKDTSGTQNNEENSSSSSKSDDHWEKVAQEKSI